MNSAVDRQTDKLEDLGIWEMVIVMVNVSDKHFYSSFQCICREKERDS